MYPRSLLSEGMRWKFFRNTDVDRVIRALVTALRTFVVESYLEPGTTAAEETAEEPCGSRLWAPVPLRTR
ncbi:MAG: hypothetical protein ACUVRX_11370 [Actinomycetota bacterium]